MKRGTMTRENRLELIKSMHKRIEYDQFRAAIRQGRLSRVVATRVCAYEHCGLEFEPTCGHQKFCCKRCQKKAQRINSSAQRKTKGDKNVAAGLTRNGGTRKRSRIHAEVA